MEKSPQKSEQLLVLKDMEKKVSTWSHPDGKRCIFSLSFPNEAETKLHSLLISEHSSLGSDTTAVGSSCWHCLLTSCWWTLEPLDCIWCPSLSAGCHLLLHKDRTQLSWTALKRSLRDTEAELLLFTWDIRALNRHSKPLWRLTLLLTTQDTCNNNLLIEKI